VVECDEHEDLRRVVAKLCHRALREVSKSAGSRAISSSVRSAC
jgi:hypothetical protein